MRKWIAIIWFAAIAAAFVFHLFALLEIFPVTISSIVLFVVLFLSIIWATSHQRYRGLYRKN